MCWDRFSMCCGLKDCVKERPHPPSGHLLPRAGEGMRSAMIQSCAPPFSRTQEKGLPGGSWPGRSPGILDSGGNAVDRGDQGVQQVVIAAVAGAPAVQQIDLDQADRVDVGVAQAD